MAFFTKQEAAALQAAFIADMPTRLEAQLKAAAANGAISLRFSYDPATDAQAQAFRTSTLLPAGWTVVVDTTLKQLVIS